MKEYFFTHIKNIKVEIIKETFITNHSGIRLLKCEFINPCNGKIESRLVPEFEIITEK